MQCLQFHLRSPRHNEVPSQHRYLISIPHAKRQRTTPAISTRAEGPTRLPPEGTDVVDGEEDGEPVVEDETSEGSGAEVANVVGTPPAVPEGPREDAVVVVVVDALAGKLVVEEGSSLLALSKFSAMNSTASPEYLAK